MIGRVLRRLGLPTRGGASVERFERAIQKAVKADERQAAALGELRDAVRRLGDRVAKQQDPLFAEGRRYLRRELEKTASGTAPIVVGPWAGEVGFELLYWIPFVRWACAEFEIDPRRLIVISRGGVASWYGVPPGQYADVFDVIDPEEFRTATAEQISLKQREMGAFDRRVLEAVAARRGLGDVNLLYPGMMFRAFKQFWDDEVGYQRVEEFTRPARLEPAVSSRPSGLPSDYVAVRFYFRRSFPDTPGNRDFAQAVVRSLARTVPVVVLTSGVRVDDHHDWTEGGGGGVTVFGDAPAARNLELQSAIISGARGFVGTYGGFSYLAPLYGVPAVAFYSRHAFETHHLAVAQRMFARIGAGALTTIDVAQAGLAGSALAPVVGETGAESAAPEPAGLEARVAAAMQELAAARGDLAAVEVKLDILEGAANALDARLRTG